MNERARGRFEVLSLARAGSQPEDAERIGRASWEGELCRLRFVQYGRSSSRLVHSRNPVIVRSPNIVSAGLIMGICACVQPAGRDAFNRVEPRVRKVSDASVGIGSSTVACTREDVRLYDPSHEPVAWQLLCGCRSSPRNRLLIRREFSRWRKILVKRIGGVEPAGVMCVTLSKNRFIQVIFEM